MRVVLLIISTLVTIAQQARLAGDARGEAIGGMIRSQTRNLLSAPIDTVSQKTSRSKEVEPTERLNQTPRERTTGHGFDSRIVRASQCPQPTICSNPNAMYRAADGSCNNLVHTDYGKSNTALQRMLPPFYNDGKIEPRNRATDQSFLPKVRDISRILFPDRNIPSQVTLALVEFSQFLIHDLSHSPFDTSVDCCSDDADVHLDNFQCSLPIDLTGDDFFSELKTTCMNFVRSKWASGPGEECESEYAEQLNEITHWIDGSMLYGSNQEQQQAIRSFTNGLLTNSSNNLPPSTPTFTGACRAEDHDAECLLTGDKRANQQPGLTAMHVLWMREHNRIANKLYSLHAQWDDETLFQEARRIVVAEIQHIAYREFLPLVMGEKLTEFGLDVSQNGFRSDYSETINPSVINEFSAAAFRFGHSLVPANLYLVSEDGLVNAVNIRDHYHSPHLIQVYGCLDSLLRGLLRFPSQSFDTFFSEEMTNHLFQEPEEEYGFDLLSVNMNRGRDHGIPPYNVMRVACGLPRASDFKALINEIHPSVISKLEKVYKSVDDIDLFVGGVSEIAIEGGMVGPTFACIIGDQFARTMKGDRFFYNLQGQHGSFTLDQLNEIRHSSLSRIICDNSGVSALQPNALKLSTPNDNLPVPCDSSSIPSVNLNVF